MTLVFILAKFIPAYKLIVENQRFLLESRLRETKGYLRIIDRLRDRTARREDFVDFNEIIFRYLSETTPETIRQSRDVSKRELIYFAKINGELVDSYNNWFCQSQVNL